MKRPEVSQINGRWFWVIVHTDMHSVAACKIRFSKEQDSELSSSRLPMSISNLSSSSASGFEFPPFRIDMLMNGYACRKKFHLDKGRRWGSGGWTWGRLGMMIALIGKWSRWWCAELIGSVGLRELYWRHICFLMVLKIYLPSSPMIGRKRVDSQKQSKLEEVSTELLFHAVHNRVSLLHTVRKLDQVSWKSNIDSR